MTAWRNQRFWSKVGVIAWLTLLMAIPGAGDAGWLDAGASNRKRVFSPGFIALCAIVVVVELIVLNHFYGVRG